jgi:hypothetical protein
MMPPKSRSSLCCYNIRCAATTVDCIDIQLFFAAAARQMQGVRGFDAASVRRDKIEHLE